ESRYFSDKTGGVWKMQSMGDGRALMLTAHDVKLVDPKELELAEKPADAKTADTKAADTKTPDAKAPESKPELKIGDKIDYQGDRLKVGALFDGKAILYEQGRHASYALLMNQVTDAELKNNYQEVKVNVDGKET